jgi:small-conductance mechanosensitive channel
LGESGLLGALQGASTQWIVTVAALAIWLVVDSASRMVMRRGVDASGLLRRQARTVARVVRVITGVLALATLFFVWGIDVEGLLLLATSVVTLTGVALFAQWSILSNITAYFILLMQDGFKRGNFVRIVELDNYIEGTVADIGPFNTRLVTEDRVVVLVPNNAMLARTVFINPRNRYAVAGKLPPPAASGEEAAPDKVP